MGERKGFVGIDLESASGAYDYDPRVTERFRVGAGGFGGAVNVLSFSATTAPTSNPTSGVATMPAGPPALPDCEVPGCPRPSALGGVGACPDHDPAGPEAANAREARIRAANGW